MDINILLITVIFILAAGAVWGWKRGFIEGVISIISCILGIVVLAVTVHGVGSFMEKSYVKAAMAVTVLLSIRIIYRTVRFLAEAFSLIRKVPGGKLADNLAGAALGFAGSVLSIWIFFLLTGIFDIMELNAWIMAQVEKSRFLTILYHTNYLTELLRQVAIWGF